MGGGSGLPLSRQAPTQRLCGESRPAVSDSFPLAAPPEGAGAGAAGKPGRQGSSEPRGEGPPVLRCAPSSSTVGRRSTGRREATGPGRRAEAKSKRCLVGCAGQGVAGTGQGALEKRSPYLKPAAHSALLATAEKGVKILPQLADSAHFPEAPERREDPRNRARPFCSAPVSRGLADRGRVCRPLLRSRPSPPVLGGCRMKGARTRWRGVGRDGALRAQRGAEAPTASSPSRWGRGAVRSRGAAGRHT